MTASHTAEPNYDEAAVRHSTLPDVLAGPDGKPASSAESWKTTARPHQFELLEKFVYGRRLPVVPVTVVGTVERADITLPGDIAAVRLQATLKLGDAADAPTTEVLLYLPKDMPKAKSSNTPHRVPVFLTPSMPILPFGSRPPGCLTTRLLPSSTIAPPRPPAARAASDGPSKRY